MAVLEYEDTIKDNCRRFCLVSARGRSIGIAYYRALKFLKLKEKQRLTWISDKTNIGPLEKQLDYVDDHELLNLREKIEIIHDGHIRRGNVRGVLVRNTLLNWLEHLSGTLTTEEQELIKKLKKKWGLVSALVL